MPIPPVVKSFAHGDEFDKPGKQISITEEDFFLLIPYAEYAADFKLRTGKEPSYPPQDGFVRRLRFTDINANMVRSLDQNSARFQDDLSKFNIQMGDSGVLYREKLAGKNSYTWVWTKTG